GIPAYCERINVNILIIIINNTNLVIKRGEDALFKSYLIAVFLVLISFKTNMIKAIIPTTIANILKSPPLNQSGQKAELKLRNSSGKGAKVFPPNTTRVSPRNVNIPPKVTIKEGILK